MATLLPQGKQQYFTSAGVPLVGGQVFTFDAGTTNPRTTYSDAAGAVPNANPVILDARGEATIYWVGNYKVQLKDALGVTIWTQDNVSSVLGNIPQSLIPATDHTYDLGSVALAWRQLYLGPNGAPAFDATSGNIRYFETTAMETAQGVAPTNKSWPPGSLMRYGADPTGVADSHTALLNACKCNSEVFDDWPGGGSYLFNSETVIPNFPLTIRGQAALSVGNSVVLNGTLFKLATAAGAGAACIRATAFISGLNINHVGFAFQSNNLGQIAIRLSQDYRYSEISRCVFGAGGTGASGTNVGIQCEGGDTYSGSNSIHDNFFWAGLFKGIWLKGACTTFKMYANEFYGYGGTNSVATLGAITAGAGYVNGFYNDVPLTGGAGAGAQAQITVAGGVVTQVILTASGNGYAPGNVLSAAAASLGGAGAGFSIPVGTVGNNYGNGIQMDGPVTEPVLSMNYFEGWCNGIYSNGAAYVKQAVNDFAVCVNAFTWIKKSGGYANVGNESIFDTLVGGAGTPIFSVVEADGNVVIGQAGYFFPGAPIQSIRGFQEGGGAGTLLRSFVMGYEVPVTFAAGNFTSNAGTWVVAAPNVATFSYTVVGKKMTIYLNIAASQVTGAPTTLQVAIPGGFQAARALGGPIVIENNGIFTSIGYWQVAAGGNVVQIFRDATGATAWTASVNTGVTGPITFPVA